MEIEVKAVGLRCKDGIIGLARFCPRHLAERRVASCRQLGSLFVDGSFASGTMRMTGGKGADVIMNSFAGEVLRPMT